MYLYPLTYGDATIEVNGIKLNLKKRKKKKTRPEDPAS